MHVLSDPKHPSPQLPPHRRCSIMGVDSARQVRQISFLLTRVKRSK